MTEEQAERMITELQNISRYLSDIDSYTSGTESNVSNLEYKFDELEKQVKITNEHLEELVARS